MDSYSKDDFCCYCGAEYSPSAKKVYPRECDGCKKLVWVNPLPVVVVFIPVSETSYDSARVGLLIQKRNIEPQPGEWALSGGYVEMGETWQQAAAREIKEELGLSTIDNNYSLCNIRTSTNGRHILIFCQYNIVLDVKQLSFIPNAEVSEIDVMWQDMKLAFPTHTEEASLFLTKLKERYP